MRVCEKGQIEEAIGLMREMEVKGLRAYGETYERVTVGCADIYRTVERSVGVFLRTC